MTYDFILGIQFEGTVEQRAFQLTETSLAIAVQKAYATMTALGRRGAAVTRLTYFHAPL